MTALTGLAGGILARLRERLAARPDTEHEQALVRLFLGALVLGYLLIVGSGQQLEPTVVVMAGYLVVAALIFAHILAAPGESMASASARSTCSSRSVSARWAFLWCCG
ncbi:MAG: hypothetical protein JF611_03395 [Betaproteobacteria bacterium]|nr:hypothetical protein [Betaproteobacteria bacterium]